MSAKTKYLLALECAPVNFRVAVFDADLRRICERAEPLRYTVRVPERVEFEPEVAWRLAVRLIRESCAQAGMGLDGVCRIAITAQPGTFCVLDAAGQPLTPFMSCQDQRAAREAALLNRRLGAGFHQHCGWPRALPGLQASLLLWLRLHRPQVLEKAATLATLPGYLAMRLGMPNLVDPNLAGLSGLLSLKTGRWWPVMLKLCGLSESQLPELTPLGKSLVKALPCRDLAFARRASVVLAGSDQTAVAFGNFCTPKSMLVTLGAGLAACRILKPGRPGPFSKEGCWGPYPGGGSYDIVAAKYGCLALDWARARLVMGRDLLAFTDLARKVKLRRDSEPGAQAEAFFYPEAINTEQVWAGGEDIGERALAVFEGIGFALKKMICEDLGMPKPPPSVRVLGAGSLNPFWLQILADILGVRVGRGAGDALSGAVRMMVPQAAASAARADAEVAWHTPRETRAYAERYERWQGHHPRTKPPSVRRTKRA